MTHSTQFQTSQLAAPVGRLLLSAIFILSGLNKISGYQGTQDFMEMFGVPSILLPAVILLEVLGGVAILVGFKVKWIAPLLAAFTLCAAFIFHSNFADQMQSIMFMKNLSIAGALIFMMSTGAGAYSLDSKFTSAKE